MSMVAFDIETAADKNMSNDLIGWFTAKKTDSRLKDEAKIEIARQKAREKFGLDPLTGSVIYASFASVSQLPSLSEYEQKFTDTNGITYIYGIGLGSMTEQDVLKKVWQGINDLITRSMRLVTYNGKDFDIPYIIKRSIILNINKPNTVTVSPLIARYSDTPHLDIFNFFGGKYGPGGTQSEYAYRMGLTSELQSDGSQIQVWYDSLQFERIVSKCKGDTYELLQMAKRMEVWV